MEASKDADMPRKSLTLVAQHPELPQLELAQLRPPTEESRHTLVTIVPRVSEFGLVEHREALWKRPKHPRVRHLSAPKLRRRTTPPSAACRTGPTTYGSSRPNYV